MVRVQGYALPAGQPDTTIDSVHVSADGGRSWTEARITSTNREYCMVLWQADVPVDANTEALIVNAIESNGRVQPKTAKWNKKGYLFNGWHRVPLRVEA
jgi:sulfite oxidase